MKNIVFIPNINLGKGRSDSYEYSIKSWSYFCTKNNCELIVWEDLLYPIDFMKITWQRYYLFDILEENNIDYNQILMVDADTIVHPDCPNFFEETEYRYCGVINDGCYEWVTRSIKNFGDELFDSKYIRPTKYINGGFQIVNSTHKPFFEIMKKYYSSNKESIQKAIDKIKAGTDQTILNYMLQKNNINVKTLPVCYNFQDLFRKNLLHIPNHSWWPDTLDNLFNAGWIYHFNAIPKNPRNANYWIERTYKELYK
tara:strand:- start:3279 stop:4043 length:765 start_codon:yes stop_codon:yes gene_type:complete